VIGLKNIELLSVHTDKDDITCANVFIPDGEIAHFEKYLQDYLDDRRGGE
jgi:hypothetical protein